jgi:hypothetical protein
MKRTHGMSSSVAEGRGQVSIYKIWANIKQRCTNPDNPRYADYGGRGITMCERWLAFAAFYEDVGDRPGNLTLDRIDNNGNYEPNNVRWVSRADNNRNSRRCVMVEINGVEKPINVWCREFGVPYTTFKQRRRNGWSLVKAVSQEPDARRRSIVGGNDVVAPNGKTIHIKD